MIILETKYDSYCPVGIRQALISQFFKEVGYWGFIGTISKDDLKMCLNQYKNLHIGYSKTYKKMVLYNRTCVAASVTIV